MPFTCPFTEANGQQYVAGSREAFRRHLTIHHGRDYRRLGDGRDEIVALDGRELADRLSAVRRSQRHRKTKPYLPPPPPTSDEWNSASSYRPVRSVSVLLPPAPVQSPADLGPPPIDAAYSPISWGADDIQDSRPDTPIDFDNDPEGYNPYAFLDELDPVESVVSSRAEAAMGHGQLPVDPVVAPPSSDSGFLDFLRSHGLAPPETSVPVAAEDKFRNAEVQTIDPRIISPSEFITYRQSFDTLTAANHMALLVRGCTSMDATSLADQTAIRLGLPPSDQPSWDALYRMAVTAVVVERHLQVRLAEILAASTVDRSGALAISSILVEIQARQRRPLDVGELPQPGDSPEQFAIMPPSDD